MTDPRIEAAARAMAGDHWNATDFGGTSNGCDPEEEREYWMDQAKIALDAADPAAWRPIEEAPKDGTHLWGFVPGRGMMVICWREGDEFWSWGRWVTDKDLRDKCEPTHFQPIPAPPIEETGND